MTDEQADKKILEITERQSSLPALEDIMDMITIITELRKDRDAWRDMARRV